ncbi:hypothetical protein VTH82DRAFT_2449 [Thermothelomyces myriococcoides]
MRRALGRELPAHDILDHPRLPWTAAAPTTEMATSVLPHEMAGIGIVVERLTKNVNEDHLYEIFGEYGEIDDLDLPVNRQTGLNRGTAYILYFNEADAQAAITHMHEAQIDGSTIHVSIVLPRRKVSPPPPPARRGPRGPPANRHSQIPVAIGVLFLEIPFSNPTRPRQPESPGRSRLRQTQEPQPRQL